MPCRLVDEGLQRDSQGATAVDNLGQVQVRHLGIRQQDRRRSFAKRQDRCFRRSTVNDALIRGAPAAYHVSPSDRVIFFSVRSLASSADQPLSRPARHPCRRSLPMARKTSKSNHPSTSHGGTGRAVATRSPGARSFAPAQRLHTTATQSLHPPAAQRVDQSPAHDTMNSRYQTAADRYRQRSRVTDRGVRPGAASRSAPPAPPH